MGQNLNEEKTRTAEDIFEALETKVLREPENDAQYTRLRTSGRTSYGNEAYITITRSNFGRDIDDAIIARLWINLDTFSPIRGPWNMGGKLPQLYHIFKSCFGNVDEVRLGMTGRVYNNSMPIGALCDFSADARFKHVSVSDMLSPEDVLGFADNIDTMLQAADLAATGLPPGVHHDIQSEEENPLYSFLQKTISHINQPAVRSAVGADNDLVIRAMIEAYSQLRSEDIEMEKAHKLEPGKLLGDLFCYTGFGLCTYKPSSVGNKEHVTVNVFEEDYPPEFYQEAPYRSHSLMFLLKPVPQLNAEEQQHLLRSANEAYERIFGIGLFGRPYKVSQARSFGFKFRTPSGFGF